jgi:uncharacterized protein YkwD
MRLILTTRSRLLFAIVLFVVSALPGRSAAAFVNERGGHANTHRLQPPVPNIVDLAEIERLEKSCFDQVNRERAAAGLLPLALSDELLAVARSYSQRMAEDSFFSHVDPQGRRLRERATEAGVKWRMLGENLASSKGYINPVAVAVRGWMESTPHRNNILSSEFRKSAVGVWISSDGTTYFTEIFLG